MKRQVSVRRFKKKNLLQPALQLHFHFHTQIKQTTADFGDIFKPQYESVSNILVVFLPLIATTVRFQDCGRLHSQQLLYVILVKAFHEAICIAIMSKPAQVTLNMA